MQLSEHLVLFSVTCDCLLFHGGIIKTGESLTGTKVPAKSPNVFYKDNRKSGRNHKFYNFLITVIHSEHAENCLGPIYI